MSKCKFCGQKAGFLSSYHKDCLDKHNIGINKILQVIEDTLTNEIDFSNLAAHIQLIANSSFIRPEEINDLYADGFENAVDKFLDDGVLSNEEEEKIKNFIDQLNLGQETLNKKGALQKAVKASIIREVTEGKLPEQKVQINGHIPFNFQKGEVIIWLFQNVEFYEQRTKTHYSGGYAGVSLKVAKGVYYRTGGFKVHPVKTEEMTFIDNGYIVITNKNLYFGSSIKNFRVQYDKILTLDPYEDGIGIQKDGASSKPQVFKNLDGWFAYNVISNLNK